MPIAPINYINPCVLIITMAEKIIRHNVSIPIELNEFATREGYSLSIILQIALKERQEKIEEVGHGS